MSRDKIPSLLDHLAGAHFTNEPLCSGKRPFFGARLRKQIEDEEETPRRGGLGK